MSTGPDPSHRATHWPRVEASADAPGSTPDDQEAASLAKLPTPIEADEVPLVPAVTMPDPEETFPVPPTTQELNVRTIASGPEASGPSRPVSPYLANHTAGVDGSPGAPVSGTHSTTPRPRKLTSSAQALMSVQQRALEADGVPAFTPRYEPSTGQEVLPEDTPIYRRSPEDQPTVDFSALSPDVVEQLLEPQYVPPAPALTHPHPLVPTPPTSSQESVEPATVTLPEDAMPTEPASNEEAAARTPFARVEADPARDEGPGADDVNPEPSDGADDVSPEAGDGADDVSPEAGDGAAEVPPVVPPVDQDSAGSGPGSGSGSGSFWTSKAFLVTAGLVVLAGIIYGVYALFFASSEETLPAQIVVTAPAEATVEPVSPTDPTDFLASMPLTVGTYALTASSVLSADQPDDFPEGVELAEGVAEQDTMTYSNGTSEITVTAWQHYNTDYAKATFDSLNVDGTDSTPVLVDGVDAGTQVHIMADSGPAVLWDNGTAVFTATGADDRVYAFVQGFGF